MSTFPNTPRVLKGGLVVLAPGGTTVRRVISLQYNPDTLTRSYQVQGVGGDGGGERAQPFRLKGPAIESIKLEAEIDATDQLEFPDQNAERRRTSASRRSSPRSRRWSIRAARSCWRWTRDAQGGTLEILPPEAPLVLFVWSRNRVVPVRVTEFSVTEEAFDPALNPIRAKVSLGLRVLTTDDLGFAHRGGTLFLSLPAHARGAGRHAAGRVAAVARPHQPAVR